MYIHMYMYIYIYRERERYVFHGLMQEVLQEAITPAGVFFGYCTLAEKLLCRVHWLFYRDPVYPP